jgi:membrane protease subunit (stomatin/prohibitin family)
MPRIIDVISHPNVMEDELVWREPQQGDGDFRFGSRVIVQESQVAIFVRQGQVLDALGPGAHTLNTGNIPLLSSALNFLVSSGKNIFTADVYFVNLRDLPQVPWGTNPPIYMETPGRGAGLMLLRNRGVIDIGIDDPIRFLKQYGIGRPSLRLADIRDRIQTVLLGEITELISKEKINSVQEANRLISSLESASLALLNTEFQALGMRIKSFQAGTFDVKDLTQEDIIKYGGDARTFAEMRRLDIAEAAAQNPGLGGAAAGAGLGLGLGQTLGAAMNPEQAALQQQLQQQQLMMQQMMMQMMANQANQQQQAQQAQPQQQAPQPPANPQTKEEIEALIANLDMRLANGEISEATYNRLVERWEKRLKELGG